LWLAALFDLEGKLNCGRMSPYTNSESEYFGEMDYPEKQQHVVHFSVE
jgi:hypothetical protein